MNVLLIGSGGREHALAWKLAQSPLLKTLFCAPGNPGISDVATNVVLDLQNHQAVIDFCRLQNVTLVVVGPEAPLVDGIADSLRAADIAVFGPSQAASQLEGSKGFTKDLCAKYDIPTAAYQRFNNAPKAKAYIRAQGTPIVIKADGLAAGKGVTVAMTMSEAMDAIEDCFEGAFGEAGAEVVVEEYLEGPEVSFFCLCDGKNAVPLTSAQDHKRVGEGDTGPNTGGMGAYSPAPLFDAAMQADVMARIIEPTMRGMAEMGHPFSGVLFCGIMVTKDGPKLIEYNVRFGDPECEVLMLRLESDLLPLLKASAEGDLSDINLKWSDKTALTVVMCAPNYPATPEKGSQIDLEAVAAIKDVTVFHAGTALKDGKLIANGGRVLAVCGSGNTVKEAQNKAYEGVKAVQWPEGFYRSDIGWRAV
ncbi:phosphoribosylamine--glycine ligase [Ahrensia marina]|uniref:Phosphoribosylamine--glycine ligase n=1 Tax=Ahrensia marina TaxID=1514904 RepID=A0A0N0VLD8_9HYPH|nr:phosphoribosylamine--glycine ligase [Ahrensia marina]KPB01114.1 phosphoribosylamine--glycine ligase [Ahrensia marina]